MTDLVPLDRREVDLRWRWRSRDGEHHYPRDMETRHLFHTLRMVWNNRMPPHMRVGERIRLYRFGSHYSHAYLGKAVLQIGAELFRRTDLTGLQQRELEEMAAWFLKDQDLIAQTLCIEDQS